ncbi:MAG: hypothetical protein NDJ89_06805 [Oligoflexia bacterium]|nr:hypothetical protein [Oligoflexia bacterium]
MKIKGSVLLLGMGLFVSQAWGQQAPQAQLEELRNRVDVLAEELNRLKTGESQGVAPEVAKSWGFAPSASKIYRTSRGISLGGYGEILYQNKSDARDDGSDAGASGLNRWDALRAVFYTGYKFNETFLVNTEIEFEHGSTGKGGEASIEFAYIDAFLSPAANLRAGLVLIPVGITNELHEPTVFLGARRPDVESSLIPTTWRENGVGLFGELGPVSYRTYLVNGLDASGFTASGIRGGRQKGAEAKADGLAWTGRLDVEPVPGLLAGVSGYLGNSGHALTPDVGTRMVEAHADWKWSGLELRALGVKTFLTNTEALNRANSLTGNKGVGSQQQGYYLQLGYDLMPLLGTKGALVPFARWERYDTQASLAAGYTKNDENEKRVLTLGVSYLPIDQLAVKVDFQDNWNAAGTGVNQVNFAVGYAF